MAVIDHVQNRSHKQSVTEAYQQDKTRKARHARQAPDPVHSPQDPGHSPQDPTARKGPSANPTRWSNTPTQPLGKQPPSKS